MLFGIEKIFAKEGDTTVVTINKIRHGVPASTMKQYKERVKVKSIDEEKSCFVRFSAALSAKRAAGTLVVDKEDPTTLPQFLIDYPKTNIDGSYFVVMSWTENTK